MDCIKITIECTNWGRPKDALEDTLLIAKAIQATLWCKFKPPYEDGLDFEVRVMPTSDIVDLREIFDLKIEQFKQSKP